MKRHVRCLPNIEENKRATQTPHNPCIHCTGVTVGYPAPLHGEEEEEDEEVATGTLSLSPHAPDAPSPAAQPSLPSKLPIHPSAETFADDEWFAFSPTAK